MVYIIPLWVLLWLAGIQGDIIYVNTEVDTLMASAGLNPMGPVGMYYKAKHRLLGMRSHASHMQSMM